MQTKHLISVSEFCSGHEITVSYINSLDEFGLINVITIEETPFLQLKELPKIEQILLFHNELEINLEGVEVVFHLLDRVREMQSELNTLKNKLYMYESS